MTEQWVAHGPDEHGSDPHVFNQETEEIEDVETMEQVAGRAAELNAATPGVQCSCQWEEGGWPELPHKPDCPVLAV